MIRSALVFSALALTACADTRDNTISSMNYLQEAVDPVCVRSALADEEGFAALTPIMDRGGAKQIEARFNEDLPITVIVRRLNNNTAEVSVFTRVPGDIDPLARREAAFAVEAADEAIYRQCTADGQINPGDPDVVIETQDLE